MNDWTSMHITTVGCHAMGDLVFAYRCIKGVGDWTAQYVAMRVLKNPDAFPSTDLGLLKAVGSIESQGGHATPKDVLHRAEAWRPWRAYAALLLWSSIANSGG